MASLFFYETSIGTIGLAENGRAVTHLIFGRKNPGPGDYEEVETPLLAKAAAQLNEYLEGKRQSFDFPMEPQGTEFQQKVWQELTKIGYGQTRTYGQIAASLGKPKASRAVGLANNRNPIGIFIPCHRVVGADGKLVGYGGGLDLKEKLLRLESAHTSFELRS